MKPLAQQYPATSLSDWLHRDGEMAVVFEIEHLVRRWVQVEVALAKAEAYAGVIPKEIADEIVTSSIGAGVDMAALHADSLIVGYPILPLLRQLDAALPSHLRGYLHLGATTQDIMDSALALQIKEALKILDARVSSIGDALRILVERHAESPMSARTHAQQAVPTTFGAKCAVFLHEFTMHRGRLRELENEVCVVSLFGAGGTSAALGTKAAQVRSTLAEELGLRDASVPWHVDRQGIAHLVTASALVASSAARFAQEIIDLSRTEVGEVREEWSHHRGASSTMPQKANSIVSEAIIGMADASAASAAGMFHAMRAGHERAAGQWHTEWKLVPEALIAASSSLSLAFQLTEGLVVDEQRMLENIHGDFGLIMSEAYMMALSGKLGREVAHDLVYEAAALSRIERISLEEALLLKRPGVRDELESWPLHVVDYLGEVRAVCAAAIRGWEA